MLCPPKSYSLESEAASVFASVLNTIEPPQTFHNSDKILAFFPNSNSHRNFAATG
jgi:hypothetical protein